MNVVLIKKEEMPSPSSYNPHADICTFHQKATQHSEEFNKMTSPKGLDYLAGLN